MYYNSTDIIVITASHLYFHCKAVGSDLRAYASMVHRNWPVSYASYQNSSYWPFFRKCAALELKVLFPGILLAAKLSLLSSVGNIVLSDIVLYAFYSFGRKHYLRSDHCKAAAKSWMFFFSQQPIQRTVHKHQVHNPTNIWQVAGQKKKFKTNSNSFLRYHFLHHQQTSWSSSNFTNLTSQSNAWICVCLLRKLCLTSLEQSLHLFAGEIGP